MPTVSTMGRARTTAAAQIEALSLSCPWCGVLQGSEKTGSQLFTQDDYDQLTAHCDRKGRPQMVCWDCRTVFFVPVIVKKLWD